MDRKIALLLVAISIGVIIDSLDASIVNVVLPSIASDFQSTTSDVAWVSITYTLLLSGLLLPFTKVSDNGNIRRVFVIGASLFALGALLCGLSTSLEMLIASRVIHGLGAAMMGSTSVMVCVKFLPEDRLSFGLSIIVLGTAIGWSLGCALGGILADFLTWHWVFYINVPLAVIAALFGFKFIPKEEKAGKFKMDYLGSALIFVAVASTVVLLELIANTANSMTYIMIAVAVVSFIAFVVVELKVEGPMLNVRMFKNWKTVALLLSFMLILAIYLGLSYTLPFFAEIGMGISASSTGLMLLAPAIIAFVLGVPIGNWCDRYGRRKFGIIAGITTLVYAVGFALFRPDMSWVLLIPILIFMGLSWATVDSGSSGRIIDSVSPEDEGMASGLVTFAMNFATAAGTALFATLLSVGSGRPGVPIEMLGPADIASGFWFSAIWAVGLAVVALILAFIVKNEMYKE